MSDERMTKKLLAASMLACCDVVAVVRPNQETIRVKNVDTDTGVWLSPEEARALRDWLNEVLP